MLEINKITNIKTQFLRNFNTSSCLVAGRQNHYDVLEVRKNCTEKDIRDAFIKLSKAYHPDSSSKNPGGDSQKFTEIMAAYKILGKSDTRAAYDHSLQFDYPYEKVINVDHDAQVFRPNSKYGFPDPSTNAPSPSSPYGINGLRKLSNRTVVYLCLIFAGVGITAQFFAIRHSLTFKRSQLDAKSARISKTHADIRGEAETLGNKIQIERMKRRLRYNED